MKAYQAKQQVGELMVGPANWVEQLPAGYSVRLRIDAETVKPHSQSNGAVSRCTDLQWYLGGRYIREASGSALMLLNPDGSEVQNAFRA